MTNFSKNNAFLKIIKPKRVQGGVYEISNCAVAISDVTVHRQVVIYHTESSDGTPK